MPRPKKMICHDCGTIFNRKPQNGDKQICWNCKSLRVTLVTDEAPPTGPIIPVAPDPSGLKLPTGKPNVGGGGITPDMLLKQRALLKKVVRPPVVLPGVKISPIPRGVRMLAYQVRNPIIRGSGIELELIWRERGPNGAERYAYLVLPSVDLSPQLHAIACGRMNPDHGNFNSRYNNLSAAMPTRKGPRAAPIFQGIRYFEYGWKRNVDPNAKWVYYNNGRKFAYSPADNRDANAFLRNLRQSKVFTERLIIAETGEIFYTPDHYGSFFRYHPGTMEWYSYRSAGGAHGPQWDESFYEEPTGA